MTDTSEAAARTRTAITPALAARIAQPGVVRALTHPAVALPLWLVNYMVWHLPWLYDAALRNAWLLNLEHLALLAIGLGFDAVNSEFSRRTMSRTRSRLSRVRRAISSTHSGWVSIGLRLLR